MRDNQGKATERTVLLVEDDPADVRVVRDVVDAADTNIDLAVVAGGDEALAYLRDCVDDENCRPPDIVLLDASLPDVDGSGILEVIKTDAVFGRVPVVVLSQSTTGEDVLPFYRRYANAVLRKPDDPAAYADALRSLERFWLSVARLPRNTVRRSRR